MRSRPSARPTGPATASASASVSESGANVSAASPVPRSDGPTTRDAARQRVERGPHRVGLAAHLGDRAERRELEHAAALDLRRRSSARDRRRPRTARRDGRARASAAASVHPGRGHRRAAPPGRAARRPAGRPAPGGRTAPGRGRGRPPACAGTRCSTASVPTTTGASGTSVTEASSHAISVRGSSAASASRSRCTPSREARSFVAWHAVQIVGRVVPQRGHVSTPGSASITAASHRSHVATVEQLRQVRSFARPLRLSTHTARSPASTVRCSARASASLSSPLPGGSTRWSTTSTVRPAGPLRPRRSAASPRRAPRSPPASAAAPPGYRRPGPARPLDRDVARVPRGDPLLLERLVALVEHDDRGEVRQRRPHRGAAPDHDGRGPGAPRPRRACAPWPRAPTG